jgi:transposase-like protein
MNTVNDNSEEAPIQTGPFNNGPNYTSAQKAEIVREIISGAITIKNASDKYRVWPSSLKRWLKPGRRFMSGIVIPRAATAIKKRLPRQTHSSPVNQQMISMDQLSVILDVVLTKFNQSR